MVVPMDNESEFLLELKFVSDSLCKETISSFSMLCSDPLFSCIVTFCTLVFIYLPHLFWKIVFSPVLILAAILLLSILRLGAIQRSQHEQKENQPKPEVINDKKNRAIKRKTEKQSTSSIEQKETEKVQNWINSCNSSEIELNSQMGFESSSSFVEWNVKAPLEVIYEEYEGEEAEDDDPNDTEENRKMGNHVRYPSLSRYYPESDSDSSSESGFPVIGDWDSPEEDICFRWDDEEDREGLIEIALDDCKMKRDLELIEEDNLIEIDISPMRYKEISGEDEIYSGEISCKNVIY